MRVSIFKLLLFLISSCYVQADTSSLPFQKLEHEVNEAYKDKSPTFISGIAKVLDFIESEQRAQKDSSDETDILRAYNFLREFLGFSKAESVKDISKPFLDDLRQEIETLTLIEEHEGWEYPTLELLELSKKAQQKTELTGDVITLATSAKSGYQAYSGLGMKTPYVALCKTSPDTDSLLFALYHELGHIHNKDGFSKRQLERGIKSIDDLISKKSFLNDLKRIERYSLIGKKIFESSHNLEISKLLTGHPDEPIWDELTQDEEAFYRFSKERRADLFMLDKLFEQRKISPILQMMDIWAKQTDSPIHSERCIFISPHPSNVERVFYMAGFLKDHGIDVIKALNEWKNRGKCVPLQTEELFPKLAKKTIMGSVLKKKYQEVLQKEKREYERWKELLFDSWKAEVIQGKDQTLDLLSRVISHLSNHQNEDDKKQALYSYNFLRERYNKPVIRKFESIDRDWLESIETKLFLGQEGDTILDSGRDTKYILLSNTKYS